MSRDGSPPNRDPRATERRRNAPWAIGIGFFLLATPWVAWVFETRSRAEGLFLTLSAFALCVPAGVALIQLGNRWRR